MRPPMFRNPRRTVFASLFLTGAVLAVAVAYTEGEPGALPLGLMLVGAIGYGLARRGRGPGA